MLRSWVGRALGFDRALLTGPFIRVLGLSLLGFTAEYVLRPVIPLMVLDRGGGPTTIGVIAAVYALPPIVFRPVIGWLADMWRAERVLKVGTALASLSPTGLLLPGILPLIPTRLSQGTAWALWSVSTRILMAQASPPDRRGAASGYYLGMPAIAVLIAPGLGVALYLTTGVIGPILIAIALAVWAYVVTARLPSRPLRESRSSIRGEKTRVRDWMVETSVLPAMVMTALFAAADTLFTVFPPVYVAAVGDPVEALALYYPAYGLAMVIGHFTVGRVSDRLGRGLTIRMGCVLGVIGVIVAMFGDSIIAFGIGAGIYALGSSLASPALSALSIDRAPAHRFGSAMATYSIGYQLAIGGSALIWGPLIATAGFDAALGVAALLILLTLAASYRYGDGHSSRSHAR